MSGNGNVIVFFRCMTNLNQSGRQIPDAWSVIIIFELIAKNLTKTLQKLNAERKNLCHSSHTITLSKNTIFGKNC